MAQQRMNVQAPIDRLFAKRWSTRAFDPDKPVTTEQVASCLEAARWAPSCFGEEPWHFIVANRFENEESWQLALECLAQKNQSWARSAPILIASLADPLFSHNNNPNRWAGYDTGQAMICFCLQAETMGMASHQMGGFDAEALKAAFGVPEQMHVMSITALGYPADADSAPEAFRTIETAPRTRKALADIVHAGHWNKSWQPPLAAGWEARYQETPTQQLPWFLAGLDTDIEVAVDKLALSNSHALDLGCGPGTQAIALAQRGFAVMATDISASALAAAKKLAAAENVAVDFRVDNILNSNLEGPFDLIVDRGCFHCISGPDRDTYMDVLQRILADDGYLLLKTFNILETGENGPPNRYSAEEIRQLFGSRFIIESITASIFHGTMDHPAKALFCILKKSTQGSGNE